MSNIRYAVAYPNDYDDEIETDFELYETHDEAIEFVNQLMHDADIQFKDGQELEFLELCNEHKHVMGEIGLYDLADNDDAEQVSALGFSAIGMGFMV